MFDNTVDSILNDILTDLLNEDPNVDVSQGSPDYISAKAFASALWGLENRGKYLSTQIVPGPNMERNGLEEWASARGIILNPSESDASLLARLRFNLRRPPAGGNKYDYVTWARAASSDIADAWTVPRGQGPGTVDLIVLAKAATTGSEIPSSDLLATVRGYIVDLCPDVVEYLRVLAPEVLLQDVTINRTDADYPAAQAIADITSSLASYLPGQILYPDSLKVLALGGGNGNAPVTAPAAPVEPTAYQMIRPGVINVT
ncbi:baseplate J/gp47 family protein [Geomonas sp. Red32]|uniref:baseplate J/gp47 family protein n=1 Tax=Geomonas sp. Red32 TaxID=2912856 RepID=UPI00202CF7C4|nr:baseplate J/gp47 family protein [Geomonas sp. Red32]MCM0081769.1 baseplate J/gp47 family protein [Geomonas sp. Red32]